MRGDDHLQEVIDCSKDLVLVCAPLYICTHSAAGLQARLVTMSSVMPCAKVCCEGDITWPVHAVA